MDEAGLQHIGMGAHPEGQRGILLHQEHRHAAFPVKRREALENRLHQKRGDAKGGLVEHEAPGTRHEGAADGQHLLFAAAERTGKLGATFLETGEKFPDPLQVAGDALAIVSEVGSHPEVFQDGQFRKDKTALGDMGETCGHDPVGGHSRDLGPVKADRSRRGGHETREGAQGCRLAGTIGPDQRDDAPGRHGERDPVQGADAAVADFQVADLEKGNWGRNVAHAAS